jgi:1-acyl-sn-glycerol-3-phosphate acyltransferase
MRLLLSLWIWSLTLTMATVFLPVLVLLRFFSGDPVRRVAGAILHWGGRRVCRFNPLWRVRVSGAEMPADGRFILISNHQSFADIPVLSCLPTPFKWVAKKELFSIPILGWLFALAGEIAVDRKDRRAGARALLRAGWYLERHMPVIFFPEGTRSPDGRLLRFNDGPFRLALKKRVPIVPVVLDGTGKLLPRKSLLFTLHTEMPLRILPPIECNDLEPGQFDILKKRVREAMQAELDRLRGAESEETELTPSTV